MSCNNDCAHQDLTKGRATFVDRDIDRHPLEVESSNRSRISSSGNSYAWTRRVKRYRELEEVGLASSNDVVPSILRVESVFAFW